MARPTIATLRGACRGQVITPDDPGNLFHINQNIKPS